MSSEQRSKPPLPSWIVKGPRNAEMPYLCSPGRGSAWGPDLSDAMRFPSRQAALDAIALCSDAGPDWPMRPVRVIAWRPLVNRVIVRARIVVHASRASQDVAIERLRDALAELDKHYVPHWEERSHG